MPGYIGFVVVHNSLICPELATPNVKILVLKHLLWHLGVTHRVHIGRWKARCFLISDN